MKRLLILSVAVLISVAGFSQKMKFGHVNTTSVFESMPERETAKNEIEKFARQLEEQLQMLNVELEEKYNNYLENAESLAPSVRQNKEKELADLQQRIQNFQASAQSDLQLKEQELIEPIYDKIKNAINEVGEAEGLLYIFDESTLLYHSNESVDVTDKVKLKVIEL
ncbi:MAG: OmpH family outer membrane protein [Bacteroidales bacterium]|nr:OmpH family outer membrane protein [Bacteroidales bacterium]MDD4235570.1 OmpH family outer membrane protein [Bacteroidales bacterium]